LKKSGESPVIRLPVSYVRRLPYHLRKLAETTWIQ
jgi:hypothetical protein